MVLANGWGTGRFAAQLNYDSQSSPVFEKHQLVCACKVGPVICFTHVVIQTVFTVLPSLADPTCAGFTGINYDCHLVNLSCPFGFTCMPSSIRVPCNCSALGILANCSGYIANVCSASEDTPHVCTCPTTQENYLPPPPSPQMFPQPPSPRVFPQPPSARVVPQPLSLTGSSLLSYVWGRHSLRVSVWRASSAVSVAATKHAVGLSEQSTSHRDIKALHQ